MVINKREKTLEQVISKKYDGRFDFLGRLRRDSDIEIDELCGQEIAILVDERISKTSIRRSPKWSGVPYRHVCWHAGKHAEHDNVRVYRKEDVAIVLEREYPEEYEVFKLSYSLEQRKKRLIARAMAAHQWECNQSPIMPSVNEQLLQHIANLNAEIDALLFLCSN